jgi:hypothetical protein
MPRLSQVIPADNNIVLQNEINLINHLLSFINNLIN